MPLDAPGGTVERALTVFGYAEAPHGHMAVALKDVMHTCWINDLRVLLRRAPRPFDTISAAWTLQRSLVPPPSAIPDVLAIRAPHERDPGFVLACEVDLGGERVKGVFAPKLVKLASLLRTWAAGAPASSCSPAANVVPRSSGVPWPNSKFAP